METELKSKLMEYLQSIESSAKDAGAFVASEAPLVAREYLNWVIFGHGFGALLLLSTAIVLLFLSYRWAKVLIAQNSGNEPVVAFPIIFATAFIISGAILATNSAKALIAPRIVIIEKLHEICR
jgi:hypothetical protein